MAPGSADVRAEGERDSRGGGAPRRRSRRGARSGRLRIRLTTLIAAGALLAGCGGSGRGTSATTAQGGAAPQSAHGQTVIGGAPADASAQIRASIEHVLAARSPSQACGADVTPNYLRTTYGDRAGCLRGQGPGSAARSVAVSAIHVSGQGASAVAVPAGGPSSGERITARLLLIGGRWRVDSLRSNAPVGP